MQVGVRAEAAAATPHMVPLGSPVGDRPAAAKRREGTAVAKDASTPAFECSFPSCTRVFARKGDRTTHQNVHIPASHKADFPYSCNKCGRRYRWRSSAKYHAGSCKAKTI